MKRTLIISALVVSSVALAVWWLPTGSQSRASAQEIGLETLVHTDYWRALVRDSGPHRARTEFLRITNDDWLSLGLKHTIAHAFSQALYKEVGSDGLSYCGDEFVYGCLHEMMGQILVENGSSIDASRVCLQHPDRVECEHGLGHGFLAFSGYEREKVPVAMEMCTTAGALPALRGCAWGVMMEWYYQQMSGDFTLQPTDPDAYVLCREFEGAARAGCVYNIPTLWSHETPPATRDATTIASIAKRCSELDSGDREACARGTGRLIQGLPATRSVESTSLCVDGFPEATLQEACSETLLEYLNQSSSMNGGDSAGEFPPVATR